MTEAHHRVQRLARRVGQCHQADRAVHSGPVQRVQQGGIQRPPDTGASGLGREIDREFAHVIERARAEGAGDGIPDRLAISDGDEEVVGRGQAGDLVCDDLLPDEIVLVDEERGRGGDVVVVDAASAGASPAMTSRMTPSAATCTESLGETGQGCSERRVDVVGHQVVAPGGAVGDDDDGYAVARRSSHEPEAAHHLQG